MTKLIQKMRYNEWTNIDIINTISILALIAYFSMPIANSFSNLFRLGYTMFFISLFYISVFMKNRQIFLKIFFTTVMVFIFIVFSYISQWALITSFIQQIYFMFLFWVPYIIMIYVLEKNDFDLYRLILTTIILFLVITSITTIRGVIISPMASRYLATGNSELYNLDQYYSMNIGGYGFIYSLVFLIPTIIYILINSKKYKLIFLFILLLFFITIIQSQYTIALILTPLSFVLFFYKKIKIVNIIALIILIYGIIYLVFQSNLSEVFSDLSTLLYNRDLNFLSYRFKQMADYTTLSLLEFSNESDRLGLYMLSIETFISKPLIGNLFYLENGSIGGHSALFDTLASLGLVGLIFLISFLRVFYKKIKINLKGYKLFNIIKYQILVLVLLSMVNTIFSSVLISMVVFLASSSAIILEKSK